MKKIRLRVAIIIITAFIYLVLIPPQQALSTPIYLPIALLRQHHEISGVLRYHSQTSVRDNTGHAWQIILFQQLQQGVTNPRFHLRLVGFPGVFEFLHPRNLEISTAQGKILTAEDVYTTDNAPATNVGEYLFSDILEKLPTTNELQLRLPVTNSNPLILKIPENIVAEWQLLVSEFK
ncbi:DUF3122 domain-containing protein [Calothrix sp. NIES-3974]|uniref:DUF3122 domain-containing protein n=1 Tax=Calothrix sp. NIES-3974 TaxID=2005462 RepID=UPI000B5E576E|nr:DUF3122 domain-containing protein [Calothrix sp. NIES-3974]BAZ08091.1 hypothetical protein NIES3974_47600 [Calothrix sp. NIES-3974]